MRGNRGPKKSEPFNKREWFTSKTVDHNEEVDNNAVNENYRKGRKKLKFTGPSKGNRGMNVKSSRMWKR